MRENCVYLPAGVLTLPRGCTPTHYFTALEISPPSGGVADHPAALITASKPPTRGAQYQQQFEAGFGGAVSASIEIPSPPHPLD